MEHYLECALWSSTGEDDRPLDSDFGICDIDAETVTKMQEDVDAFVEMNTDLLNASGLSEEQIGHDFWLTRNRHGAGFWDRGLGDIGRKLSEASKVYGEASLYVGDDGKIHVM